jgi:hypothetical protein
MCEWPIAPSRSAGRSRRRRGANRRYGGDRGSAAARGWRHRGALEPAAQRRRIEPAAEAAGEDVFVGSSELATTIETFQGIQGIDVERDRMLFGAGRVEGRMRDRSRMAARVMGRACRSLWAGVQRPIGGDDCVRARGGIAEHGRSIPATLSARVSLGRFIYDNFPILPIVAARDLPTRAWMPGTFSSRDGCRSKTTRVLPRRQFG